MAPAALVDNVIAQKMQKIRKQKNGDLIMITKNISLICQDLVDSYAWHRN